MTVHIPLRIGENIQKEVWNGIKLNGLDVMTYSSEDKNFISLKENVTRLDRWAMAYNWLQLLKNNNKESFVGMDSDVLLPEGIIKRLILEFEDCEMLICRSKPGDSIQHGLWIMRRKVIDSVPLRFPIENECPMCSWIGKIKGDFKVQYSKQRTREIKR